MLKIKLKPAGWKLLCFGILTTFFIHTNAQNSEDIKISGEFINRPLKELISFLEDQYNINVFYKQEWIEDIIIDQRYDEAPLYQALTRTLRETGLAFEFFQNNDLILLPEKLSQNSLHISGQTTMQIIGDPLNIGRYRTAKLNGKVVDGKNGEALIGAVVYSPKYEKGASTDSEGRFSIDLPTGEHNLQLSYMGYEQNSRRIKLIESGEIELELFEESHNLGEVTVTSEGINSSRTQMSMVRVDSKILKELPGLMGESDVIKSITMLAGVQTVSELSSGFNVRGGNTDQNLILVNGTPVFNPSHLFGFFSMLNPDVIDDVRLYKGGMPARLGERVSSVMEVDIKEGNDENISIYGGLGLLNSRFTLEGPLTKNKKLKILAGGRTSYSDWILKKIPDTELSESVTNFYDISGKATYVFNLHNKLSLMAYSSNDEFSTSSETMMEYGNMLANMMLKNRLGEKLNAELNFSYSRYKSRLTDLANEKDFESYYLDNKLEYFSGKYNFNWHPQERHGINFGASIIRYKLNPGEVIPAAYESVIVHRELQQENAIEWAGYISDEFLILPELILNAGIRLSGFQNLGPKIDYIYDPDYPKSPETIIDSLVYGNNEPEKSFMGLEPRLALSYNLNHGYSLKMSYQRTRQYVSQISNSAVASPVESYKFSDYHLEPLISDQVAIGVSSNPGNSIQFTTELYYKQLKNLIEYKNGADIIMNEHLETELIPSDGYSYGVEISANKPTGRLTGMINYMFSRTMRTTDGMFDEEKINRGEAYPSIYDKPHDLSVTTTYNISRRWRVSGNFVFISGRPVTLPELKYFYAGQSLIYYSDRNKYRMPPYNRFDISITIDENLKRKRSWKGSWTFSVYNVYGRNNPYSIYYRKGKPNPGNNYSVYSLYKLSVIGIPIPTITYNFRF